MSELDDHEREDLFLKLSGNTIRVTWFAELDNNNDAIIHWALAQWIVDKLYGWPTSRYDDWEARFVYHLLDLAELGDTLEQCQ